MFQFTLIVGLSILSRANAKPTGHSQQPAKWTSCPAALEAPLLQCAQINVPLDYDRPSADLLNLTLVKLPAAKPKQRKGTLVFQEGGPGNPSWTALQMSTNRSLNIFGSLRDDFDIVTAEPRGVAFNYPVVCDPKFAEQRISTLLFPTTEREYNEIVDFWGEFGKSCLQRTGKVLEHMDTNTQAHDLEAVRLAIGEGGINYCESEYPLPLDSILLMPIADGLSWGTLRGSRYAQMYPRNIRAMILDAVVDHSITRSQFATSESLTFGLTQRRMLDWMGTNKTSPLQGRDAVQIYHEIIRRANKSPYPAPGTKAGYVTANDLRRAIFESVQTPSTWLETAAALKEIHDENNVTAVAPALQPLESGVAFANLAIACNDWPYKQSWAEYRQQEFLNAAYSLDPQSSTAARVWDLACQKWPTARNSDPAGHVCVDNPSAEILLVNALWDPATGYDQALNMHKKIERSFLLTRYGEGHGSWNSAGFPETFQAMQDYIRNLKLPQKLLTDVPKAEVDTDFEMFPWSELSFNTTM